jgi:hypothetical protein
MLFYRIEIARKQWPNKKRLSFKLPGASNRDIKEGLGGLK